MKKITLLICLLLLLPLVTAQTGNTTDLGGSVSDLKESVKSFDGFFEKEHEIPENLQGITKILFRFEGNITVSKTIIALMILITFFLTITDIVKAFGPFDPNTTAPVIGIVLTLILAMTGIIKSFTIFLLNFGGNFRFLEEWSAGALFFTVILIAVVAIILIKLLKTVKQHRGLEQAYEKGAKAGAHHAYIDAMQTVSGSGDKI